MLRDIAAEKNYIPLWDEVIIDAIKYGVISHARVERLLNERYNGALIADEDDFFFRIFHQGSQIFKAKGLVCF